MAETIRDVTIRIGIKQESIVLKTPDIRQFQTAIQNLQKNLSDSLRNASRITVEVPDFTEVTTGVGEVTTVIEKTSESVVDLDKRFEEMLDDVVDGAEDAADALVDVRRETEKQNQSISKLKSETVDFGVKSAEGFKTAGDGAFQLARSMAILTSSDEDLQVIIQRIAMLQSVFDVFRGSIDLIKGTIEGVRAFRSASLAAAAAQETLAAVTTASGTAATGASVGFTLLNKSMGKIGLIITGISLALGAAAAAWLYFRGGAKKAGEDAPKDLAKIAEAQRKLNEERKERQEINEHFLQKKTSKLELQTKIDELKVSRDQLTIQQQIAQIEARKTGAFGFESVDRLKRDAEGFRFGQFDPEAGLDSAKELQAVLRLQEENERKKLSLIQQQETVKQKSLDNARSELQTLKETLATEEGRKQTLQERIGRLNPRQLRQFQKLSEKAKAGDKLAPKELAKLESLGGSGVSDFTGKKFSQIGQQRGALDLFKPFGTDVNKDIANTKGQISDKEDGVKDLADEVQEFIEKKKQQEKESINKLIDKITELEAIPTRIDELERNLKDSIR